MEKLGTCSKFSGYPYENAERFIREFESFAALHELDDDDETVRKLAAFHLHLKGPALTWYNSLGVNEDSTWVNIRQEFTAKYIRLDWQHPSVVVENENFHSLILKPGQNIEDYYCLVYEKGQMLGKPEHEMMAQFLKGLPEKLAFYVRASKPIDISEALNIARTGEAYNYRLHEPSLASVKNVNSHSAEMSEMKLQINQLTDAVKSLTVQKSQPENRSYYHAHNFEGQPRRRGACFSCNAQGHNKTNCNWNGQGTPALQMTCQLCSQGGHDALHCKTLNIQSMQPQERVQCQICSRFGHKANECYRLKIQGNQNNLGATGHAPPGGR